MISNDVRVGGRWMRASKQMDGPCHEVFDEVIKHIKNGVAMDGFLVMMGRMSMEVIIDGLVSCGNRGLRTYRNNLRRTVIGGLLGTHALLREG